MVSGVVDAGIEAHLAPVAGIIAALEIGGSQLKCVVAHGKRLGEKPFPVVGAVPCAGVGYRILGLCHNVTVIVTKSEIDGAGAFVTCRHFECIGLCHTVFKSKCDFGL